MYYQNYHKHTSLSHRYNKDSSLVPIDYFNAMLPLAKQGIPQIYSTVEHGWQSNYFHIYDDLEKFNKKNLENNENYTPIKFIFGTEAYWVNNHKDKDASNNHIILLAKNDNGRKAINRALAKSFISKESIEKGLAQQMFPEIQEDDIYYYYKNRMDIDLLLSLPKDDVFVTTACIAFWLKYSNEGNNWTKIDEDVIKLNNHFTDFYLEVQANNTDKQKIINQHILQLHEKYNIPLIAGTDSHEITYEQMEDREYLLKSNHINYPEEDGNYMDFPTYDTLVQRFQKQNVLSDEQIIEAINNTNKILNFEDIVLDRSLKVPVAKMFRDKTQEERNQIFKNILVDEWKKQRSDINEELLPQYQKELKHDINEILSCNMADYFIDDYYIVKRGVQKYGGIITPTGRGSAVSMYLNKLLGLTKVDKVNSPVTMYSERFLTATRIIESKTPPDIDNNISSREPFIQAQRDIIGTNGTFDLLALGTLKYKSAFKMYARANKLDPQLANEVTKQIDKYENALKHKDDDETEEDYDIYDYVDKEKYGYLIDGCQSYRGIVDTLKGHPCATLAYNGNAIDDVGVIMVKSESTKKEVWVALQESATMDSFGYIKNDWLVVDSIGLTYDIYKEIGMTPMTINELLKKIDGDKKTWDIYKNGYTMCINQVEQKKSTEKVMRFQPKNIYELCQFVAGIRPSFQTMYKILESRTHFDYGIKAFDDILQDKYCDSSFILYQESLMKVLGFAGFPMSETYTIIKAISKKKKYVIDEAKKKFIPNFTQAILDTKETNDINEATKTAEKVWKIIENSASYGFNCLSRKTKLYRDKNDDYTPTIEEMYNIMNDKEYAIRTGHISLHYKYKNEGYGMCYSLGNDGRIYQNKIIDIYKQPKALTYKITTKEGREIIATANHKFPIDEKGNTKVLSKLKIGDKLIVKSQYEPTKKTCNLTRWDKGCPIEYDEIISIEKNEIEDVYDVSVSGDVSHTFLIDNGIMTSNCSHSYCMALDSVTLAWLKAHYPYEFYKVTLQRYTDKGQKDKVTKLKKEMSKFGIHLEPVKFGDDNRKFNISESEGKKYITQTMASIKNMQKVVPNIMYELGKKKYNNFLSVLYNIKKTEIDSSSLDILIKLDYFSDFGDINYLLNVVKYYNKYIDNGNFGKTKRKQFRIADLDDVKKYYPFEKETILKFKTEESKNGNTIYVSQENMYKLIVYLCSKLKKNTTTLYDRITYEATLLGYVSITSSDSPYWAVTNVEVNQYGTPFASLYRVSDGLTEVYKVNRQYYKEYGLNTGDIIYPLFNTKNKSIKKDNKWVQTDETYEELSAWKWSD